MLENSLLKVGYFIINGNNGLCKLVFIFLRQLKQDKWIYGSVKDESYLVLKNCQQSAVVNKSAFGIGLF